MLSVFLPFPLVVGFVVILWSIYRLSTKSVIVGDKYWTYRSAFLERSIRKSAVVDVETGPLGYVVKYDGGEIAVGGIYFYSAPGYPDGLAGRGWVSGMADAPVDDGAESASHMTRVRRPSAAEILLFVIILSLTAIIASSA
jgi:hypothetical protein